MLDIAEAASRGDAVMILLPDEKQAEVWESEIADGIAPGNLLLFAHGFAIHFEQIVPPAGVDVGMVAPKGPGHLVRRQYEEGRGVPCLMAVQQDATGNAHDLVLAYASGIGGGRAAVIETTFKDECETDLFGEQAVLCGGASELVRAGFETLVEAGYDPRLAYFECLHELKLIADLMYEKGIQGMRYSISNTAEYGDMTRGKRVIGEESRAAMKEILGEIQSGEFAREWIAENRAGGENLSRMREEGARATRSRGRQGAARHDALDRPGVLSVDSKRGGGPEPLSLKPSRSWIVGRARDRHTGSFMERGCRPPSSSEIARLERAWKGSGSPLPEASGDHVRTTGERISCATVSGGGEPDPLRSSLAVRLALGEFAVAADVAVLAADDDVDGVLGVAEVAAACARSRRRPRRGRRARARGCCRRRTRSRRGRCGGSRAPPARRGSGCRWRRRAAGRSR